MRRAKVLRLLTLIGVLLRSGIARAEPTPKPPPNSVDYFQYGVALAFEQLGSAADVCPASASVPCILGSGGGLVIRAGYRSRGPWMVGGAYEFSRHDSSNLLRLAILQQLRGEARYYADRSTRLSPYATMGAGLALYGSEWGASTGGLVATLGLGVEFQITQATVVGCAPMYRAFLLRNFTDSAGQHRADRYFGFGLAHFIGLELVFEVRDPLPRW
jgi:hypothetical protein